MYPQICTYMYLSIQTAYMHRDRCISLTSLFIVLEEARQRRKLRWSDEMWIFSPGGLYPLTYALRMRSRILATRRKFWFISFLFFSDAVYSSETTKKITKTRKENKRGMEREKLSAKRELTGGRIPSVFVLLQFTWASWYQPLIS